MCVLYDTVSDNTIVDIHEILTPPLIMTPLRRTMDIQGDHYLMGVHISYELHEIMTSYQSMVYVCGVTLVRR